MLNVVFLHGLNTWGDDLLHVGPFKLGSMNAGWETALRARGVAVHCPSGLGHHEPVEQAEVVLQHLKKDGWLEKPNLFVVGHSAGGLIARVLACHDEARSRLRGVVTVGTPHHGAEAANFGMQISSKKSSLGRLMRAAGYDTDKRIDVYRRYLSETMREFNQRYMHAETFPFAFARCECPVAKLSWPLTAIYPFISAHLNREKSDGWVGTRTQAWGECIGTYELDHFGNMGNFLQPLPRHRQDARAEFQRLVDDVVTWMNAHASN